MNEVFRVDLRLCVTINNKNYDISNIEFKKNGNDARLVREDQAKVLSEGKLIINQLCKVHNLSLEEGLKKKAVVGQIRGNIYNLSGFMTVSLIKFSQGSKQFCLS